VDNNHFAGFANVMSVGGATTNEKILSFCHLPSGWNYGRGKPASVKTALDAMNFVNLFYVKGVRETDAFPGPNGEIAVTAYAQDYYLNVGIESDGRIEVSFERNRGEIFDKDCENLYTAYYYVMFALSTMVPEWNTPASLMSKPSTIGWAGSTITPSKPMAKMAVYP
jgi:hypothetical protein